MAPSPLQAEEVAQLGKELQAILQAGVPLDLGLRGLQGSVSRRVDLVAQRLATQLENGVSLADAIQAEETVPESLRTALVAGIRCGRSEEALRDIVEVSMNLSSFRSVMIRNLIYPTVVCLLSLILLTCVSAFLIPIHLSFYETFRVQVPFIIRIWNGLNLPLVIPALAALAAVTYLLMAFTGLTGPFKRGVADLCGWGQVRGDLAISRLAGLLALLTKYQVPLPEALTLAGASAESRTWKKRIETLATSVNRGAGLSEQEIRQHGFPPFLAWLIDVGAKESSLPSTLHQAAVFYQQRGFARAQVIQKVIPLFAMIVVGGGVALVYGALVFETLVQLWKTLGDFS